jgi:hypothetical protein
MGVIPMRVVHAKHLINARQFGAKENFDYARISFCIGPHQDVIITYGKKDFFDDKKESMQRSVFYHFRKGQISLVNINYDGFDYGICPLGTDLWFVTGDCDTYDTTFKIHSFFRSKQLPKPNAHIFTKRGT